MHFFSLIGASIQSVFKQMKYYKGICDLVNSAVYAGVDCHLEKSLCHIFQKNISTFEFDCWFFITLTTMHLRFKQEWADVSPNNFIILYLSSFLFLIYVKYQYLVYYWMENPMCETKTVTLMAPWCLKNVSKTLRNGETISSVVVLGFLVTLSWDNSRRLLYSGIWNLFHIDCMNNEGYFKCAFFVEISHSSIQVLIGPWFKPPPQH